MSDEGWDIHTNYNDNVTWKVVWFQRSKLSCVMLTKKSFLNCHGKDIRFIEQLKNFEIVNIKCNIWFAVD